MDDFADNSKKEEAFEESTVFSAPAEHNDKKLKSPKKSRIITAIAAVLAVCLLVGGTLAVIKLIPEKDDENTTSEVEKLLVLDLDKKEFDAVTVDNNNGKFEFYPKTPEGEDDAKWYIKGIAEEKISTSKTENIVSAAAKIEAIMEITKKTYDECGFNSSSVKISVSSGKLGDYSVLLGDISPDNSGIYLYSSLDEKIYLVSNEIESSFVFTDLELANTDAIAPITDKEELKSYVENGVFTTFDNITVSGKSTSTVIIEPISKDEVSNVGFYYRVTSPVKKYADTSKVEELLSPYTSGIQVSGIYSFETDADALKKFGLDKPDYTVSLSVGGNSYSYSFSLQGDGSYAAFGDGFDTIKKVSTSAVQFLSLKDTDYYNKMVYVRPISEIKNMTFVSDEKTYSFDISENGEEDDEKYTVMYNSKRIKSDYYQNFYMHFVSITVSDFSFEKIDTAALTVNITDNDGKTQTLSFYKASATEYYCSLDGSPVGKITASSYNKLLSDLKTVSENKDVKN